MFLTQGYPNKKKFKRQCQWITEDGIQTADFIGNQESGIVNKRPGNAKNSSEFKKREILLPEITEDQ